jgi:hypothetical protein
MPEPTTLTPAPTTVVATETVVETAVAATLRTVHAEHEKRTTTVTANVFI